MSRIICCLAILAATAWHACAETRTDVRSFGAVGDGTHDDTEAFRRAIEHGGRIHVPFGVYKLTDTLQLRNSAYLLGDGVSAKAVEKRTVLQFHGLGDKPAIITRSNGWDSGTYGLECLSIEANSWDPETGCTGNGLDIQTRINCRMIVVRGFGRHNLFLHGDEETSPTQGNAGPYFAVFDTCEFYYSGSHGVVVGTLSNGVTFINVQVCYSGAPAFMARPTEPGEADGVFVSAGGAGNPDGRYRSWAPENLQILGGQASYNSRYGYNFDQLRTSFVITGYAEGNLVGDKRQVRVGSGTIACQLNLPHSLPETVLLEAPALAEFVHPNAIWAAGVFLGAGLFTAEGHRVTPLLNNVRTHLSSGSHSGIYVDSDDRGNLIVGNRGVPGTVMMQPDLRVGDGTREGRLTVAGTLTAQAAEIGIPDPAQAGHSLPHQVVVSPQAQLLYRGTVHLTGGRAVVDLDAAAGLPLGTFAQIAVRPQAFVQNLSAWEPLRTVWSEDGKLEISSRTNDESEVAWLVVADRAPTTSN